MDISWIITAFLGGVIIYCLKWLNEKNTYYWKEKGVPIIYNTSPIFGFFLQMILFRKSIREIFSDMYKNLDGKKYGGYFQFFTPAIMIRDTELASRVLIKDFTHFEDRGPPQEKSLDILSMSLNNLTGDEWRAARHKLTPTFTSGKLKMMFEPIKECCEKGVLFLKDKIGHDIEARGLMGKFIIKIIATVAFGLDIDTFNEKEAMNNEFIKATTNFFKPTTLFLLKMLIISFYPKVKKIFKLKILDDDINNFFQKTTKEIIKQREESGTRRNDFLQLMIDERKKEQELLYNENKPDPSNENIKEEPEDKELLEQLKNTPNSSSNWSRSDKMFTDEFIAAQTFLFISGGSETTAASLSFVLYELAVNQDVQKRVKKEITDILSSQELNYQAVKKMVYLEQTINESFRLHTIAPVLIRYCKKDYKIPDTDVVIEKETIVSIPAGSLQKDPQYFPDPEKFNPDRFEDMEAIPKGVFFPFGSGPRICIAMRLAMLEMKIVLAVLLLNYRVTLSKKTKLPLKLMKSSVLNNVEGGLWVKFEEDN